MSDYLQPDFYRFNEDSLKLVKWVKTQEKEISRIADLGAGSGVIGIELARTFRPQGLLLLELQDCFAPFLRENCSLFLPEETRPEILISSFGAWMPKSDFDVIVCNPPYYLPGRGEASQNKERQLCRSFEQDGWEELISAIRRGLSPAGTAYLVMKSDKHVLAIVKSEVKKMNLQVEIREEKALSLLKISSTA